MGLHVSMVILDECYLLETHKTLKVLCRLGVLLLLAHGIRTRQPSNSAPAQNKAQC